VGFVPKRINRAITATPQINRKEIFRRGRNTIAAIYARAARPKQRKNQGRPPPLRDEKKSKGINEQDKTNPAAQNL
jgi:ribose 1,5-bisphosphokinase PhnN